MSISQVLVTLFLLSQVRSKDRHRISIEFHSPGLWICRRRHELPANAIEPDNDVDDLDAFRQILGIDEGKIDSVLITEDARPIPRTTVTRN